MRRLQSILSLRINVKHMAAAVTVGCLLASEGPPRRVPASKPFFDTIASSCTGHCMTSSSTPIGPSTGHILGPTKLPEKMSVIRRLKGSATLKVAVTLLKTNMMDA